MGKGGGGGVKVSEKRWRGEGDAGCGETRGGKWVQLIGERRGVGGHNRARGRQSLKLALREPAVDRIALGKTMVDSGGERSFVVRVPV